MSRLKTVKNAFANLCRGGATALVTLILPPFLTRILSTEAYNTWLLILQLSTYVSLLDFGIQTAVGRYVAHCNELGDKKKRDSIVTNAIGILTFVGLLALVGVAIAAWQLPHIFPSMPILLQNDARLTLLAVGSSLAISLPFNVFGALFIGLQRYDIPAWIIGISRLLSGLFVIVIAQTSHSIVMMGLSMAMANLLTGLWQYLAYRKIAKDINISVRQLSKSTMVEITHYCTGLLVWTVAMFLISGMDTAIIGYFDYKSVVYYTLASSITMFVTGLQSSVLSTILPNAAAISARGDKVKLGNLLVASTRYTTILLIITSLPFLLEGRLVLTWWVGEIYADKTAVLLQLLILAGFIRQLGAPYSTIVVGAGEQRLIILSPLIEGVVNLSLSILLVSKIGVIGVAIGTIMGGLISVISHFFYNLPRTKCINLSSPYTVLLAIGKPLISLLPVILFYPLIHEMNGGSVNLLSLIPSTLTALLTLLILYFYVVTNEERNQFTLFIRKRLDKHPH
jgi:O-antigen/teichoic acid export membrane protein